MSSEYNPLFYKNKEQEKIIFRKFVKKITIFQMHIAPLLHTQYTHATLIVRISIIN